MDLTPSSGAQSYCAPDAFIELYDKRHIGMVVRDDNTIASPAELLTDPVLGRILATASGEVEMAALAGNRYKASDLAALTGNGKAKLEQIVADLAYGRLLRRRGVPSEMPPQVAEAEDVLKDLRSGAVIFPFAETADAGHAVSVKLTGLHRAQQNFLSDRLHRMLGTRGHWDRPYPGR